jgi:hypothetical protein
MGRIFSQMGHYYPWARPDYMLNEMSLPLILMYYDYMAEAITGKPAGPNKNKPDLRGFRRTYGSKIITPNRR